jgi:hypothetical protein
VQHPTGGLDPVVDKNRLHLRHHRTLDLIVALAPMGFVLGVAEPLVAHADATGEADSAIHDQDFAVRAIVQPPQMKPRRRMIELQVAASFASSFQEIGVHAA